MAKGDVKVIRTGGAYEVTFLTNTSTSLYPGDLVKKNGDYVTRIATGDPEIGTDTVVGVVVEASTDTASVAGTCKVLVIAADTILRFNAHTSTNVNTAAKINALKMHAVALDLTGTTITINEDETDDPNVHGFVVINGDEANYTLDVLPQVGILLNGGSVGQTRD